MNINIAASFVMNKEEKHLKVTKRAWMQYLARLIKLLLLFIRGYIALYENWQLAGESHGGNLTVVSGVDPTYLRREFALIFVENI